MIKRTLLLAIAIATTMGIVTCKKDNKTQPDKPNPGGNVKTHTFDTRAFDKWVYFSFAENKEVEIADFQTSMDWDIAFHRFDVRVNCGTAGPDGKYAKIWLKDYYNDNSETGFITMQYFYQKDGSNEFFMEIE